MVGGLQNRGGLYKEASFSLSGFPSHALLLLDEGLLEMFEVVNSLEDSMTFTVHDLCQLIKVCATYLLSLGQDLTVRVTVFISFL